MLRISNTPSADSVVQLFGRSLNTHTMHSLFSASELLASLSELQEKLSTLSAGSSDDVGRTLEEVEASIQLITEQAMAIKSKEASAQMAQVSSQLEGLKKIIVTWREIYPNMLPVRIDNRKYYLHQ